MSMIPPLHAETTAEPQLIRWSIGAQTLPADSPPVRALVDDGVLQRVDTAPGEVLTWLSDGRSWTVDGPRVRSALFDALSTASDVQQLSDDELLDAVAETLQRDVAPVADSHGGTVTALSVADGILTVEFGGACHGCAASGKTLSDLVSRSVRLRYPQIREVRAASSRRTWLPLSTGRIHQPPADC